MCIYIYYICMLLCCFDIVHNDIRAKLWTIVFYMYFSVNCCHNFFLRLQRDTNMSKYYVLVSGLAEKDRTPKEGCTVAGAEAVANEVTEIFSQSHISSDPPNYSHLR